MNKSLANKVLPPQFHATLTRLIEPHNRKAHDRLGGIKRDCCSDTRDDRKAVLLRAFAELSVMGFKFKSPTSLREKHLQALADHWKSKELAASTCHKRFSILRVFAGWINKPGLVGDLEDYFDDPGSLKRPMVATKKLAWEDRGVKFEVLIEQAKALDERFALYLSLQHHFGLRVKESIQLRPLHSAFDDVALEISEGSKGGRPRLVQIETPEQREVLNWARLVATQSHTGRIRWPQLSWLQAQSYFYRLMERIGATKAQLGITAHGLRHGDAQRQYEKITGRPSPIQGGKPEDIDWATHHLAALKVSSRLGHGRPEVTGSYYGSHGHALRAKTRLPYAEGNGHALKDAVSKSNNGADHE